MNPVFKSSHLNVVTQTKKSQFVIKWLWWVVEYSHWLHLLGFSPLCNTLYREGLTVQPSRALISKQSKHADYCQGEGGAMAKPNLNTREDTRKWDCSVMAKPTLKSEYDPVPQEAGSRFHSFTSCWCIVQDSTDSAIARMPKYEVDIPCRSQMTRLASITSYWARLSKPNVRRSSYKDGVMGEMGHWTQPILFRFW